MQPNARRAYLAPLLAAWLAGCGDTTTEGPSSFSPAQTSGDPDAGSVAEGGMGTSLDPVPDFRPPNGAGSTPGNGSNLPAKALLDTDCDGLSDWEEEVNSFAGGRKTDRLVADTDGDGILDGIEMGRMASVVATCSFVGDSDSVTKTSPTAADSDGDGLPDGLEDRNANGKVDPGETNPMAFDTDGDGLSDGVEDANQNGTRDPGETNPLKADTDGDGIGDAQEKKVTKTDPLTVDTDGDGCPDGTEDINRDGVKQPNETDPNVPGDCNNSKVIDSDGDGIPDVLEDTNGNKKWDPGETDLSKLDTDGDGIPDGIEDRNLNGVRDGAETDPRSVDSDCDGLIDGPTVGAVKGEDLNGNGTVDPGETDPVKADTDGDGISDGVESGISAKPTGSSCPSFTPDANPLTTTNPLSMDSDGDGIRDGAEDANQNGRVDSGELDPNDKTDAKATIADACTDTTARQVLFHQSLAPDLQLALPTTFKEVKPILKGGAEVGVMGYDSTTQVAFVAYRASAPGAATTAVADEAALRTVVATQGALSDPRTQSFTTWDNFSAVKALYDQAGTKDLKAQANALAEALVGTGSGVLTSATTAAGPFKIQAEYIHRSNQSVVTVLALTPGAPGAATGAPAIFTMKDTAGGSAVAQFGDGTALQCEPFVAAQTRLDFLFVVDNSGSMDSYQQSLANSADAMEAALNASKIDWRLGLVTTDYDCACGSNYCKSQRKAFTTNIAEFKTWLQKNQPGWVGTSGCGGEQSLASTKKAIDEMLPPSNTDATKVRSGARLVVVLLGDADDQSGYTGPTYASLFAGYTNTLGSPLKVHGIVCPLDAPTNGNDPYFTGQKLYCNETQMVPRRNTAVIAATGGIVGSINGSATSIASTMDAIVQDAIASTGYKLQKPPIGTSIKVALSSVDNAALCPTKADIPRSRENGFDFDGVNGTISFFGGCRPTLDSATDAVSYKYWIDTSSNPNGRPLPCQTDPYFDPAQADFCKGVLACNEALNKCECPADCGTTVPKGYACNTDPAVCALQCRADCGGCGPNETCDQAACACKCNESATCMPGYTFSKATCSCACDANALACDRAFAADLSSCSCVCKPDCGGCPSGSTCNASICACVSLPK